MEGVHAGEKVLKVVKITQIDDETDIDIDSNIRYKWIVGLLDNAAQQEAIAQEKDLIEKLKRRRKQSAAKQAMAALGIDEDTLKRLK